jgi:hypothetical protein
MPTITRTAATRLAVALAATAAILSLGTSSVLAGEVTGNGRLIDVQGRSACAFSGQEDLQFFTDNGDATPKDVITKGDPGHAQSWGQIPKAVRDQLTMIGLNPGVACNPTKATGE